MAEGSSSSSGNVVQTTDHATRSSVSIINSSFGHPLSTVLAVKLDDKNYILWRGMVLAILRGQRVEGYVLGKKEKLVDVIEIVTEKGRSRNQTQLMKNGAPSIRPYAVGFLDR